ncbi:MAG: hypothetical protein U9O87_07945 [Verrucomicrobiota bacterium]|nr:hypothetical protein [Verrucomicrobiota bacterium]
MIENLEKLNSFNPEERKTALLELSASKNEKTETENVNMHFHSFFSYNAEDWSPSRIAWESKQAGLYAAGLCDFDVLDGLEEFLDAGKILGLRSTVNLETRAFLNEYSNVDINSPGEHGVTYIMGAGFTKIPKSGTKQAEGLAGYRQRAKERNIALIKRVNAKLSEIAINYDNDVLPLTPSGAATERHIVIAYIKKAENNFADKNDLLNFWSNVFGETKEKTLEIVNDLPLMENVVRAKLAKRGGIGYVQPSVDTFPSVDEFIDWVASCGAVPMITWLDGTNDGEADAKALLTCLKDKGATALNIVPDRNWNFADAETQALKVAKLSEMVESADSMGLPINIGTEMNKAGQPFADDLNGKILSKYKNIFLKGARIMVGHSILAKYADFSYCGEKAKEKFSDIFEMNAFFEKVGTMPPITLEFAEQLCKMEPKNAFEEIIKKYKYTVV